MEGFLRFSKESPAVYVEDWAKLVDVVAELADKLRAVNPSWFVEAVTPFLAQPIRCQCLLDLVC